MSSREFSSWRAYYEIEPWGFGPQEIQSALIAMEASRQTAKHPGRLRIQDYMVSKLLKLRKPGGSKRQTAEEMMALMKAFAAAHNNYRTRKGKRGE